MRLLKVDYQDGLGGALYYIQNTATKYYEKVSKNVFEQLIKEANDSLKIDVSNNDGTIRSEFHLTF